MTKYVMARHDFVMTQHDTRGITYMLCVMITFKKKMMQHNTSHELA